MTQLLHASPNAGTTLRLKNPLVLTQFLGLSMALHRGYICLLLIFPIALLLASGPSAASEGQTSYEADDDPRDAQERLEAALARYRDIARDGGWPEVRGSGIVEAGDTAEQVSPLRRRLALTGDLPGESGGDVYGEEVAAAVYRFQKRHGLAADSILGPNTRAALNVPAEDRIRTMEINLQRWNELPEPLGRRSILVNIPEFRLRAYNGGKAMQMDVVVGKEFDGRATPVFSDEMEYVVFRPYWNIPHSIATEEILPEAREDRSFLVENDYEIAESYAPDARTYDPFDTDLDRVASGELRIRQKPGDQNALGLVKFMFPNRYAVYLHGTPEDHLFERRKRAFSHGCIRVERPAELARFILGSQGWAEPQIHDAMHDGERQRVDLDERIPVHIVYFTAFVEEDDIVQFRKDIYGHDEEESIG